MPPKKKAPAASKCPKGMGKPISPGLKLVDLTKKEWKLGEVIGQGGFGYIYLGGRAGEAKGSHVIKIEPHNNGPLFVEQAFYQRVAKPEMSWIKEKKVKHVGIPEYLGGGLFEHEKAKYRFLIMERFGHDVEKVYKEHDFVFPEATVFSLGIRLIDALEYMHCKEYVHADIKSSNIMLGYQKTSQQKAYLVDFGLAYRYNPSGTHVSYKEDPKRRHDGTVEYTSIDAHKGCAPSRRGDLEILGYCMLQWLCKRLPWEKNLNDKEYVMKEKIKYISNIPQLMKECFSKSTPPGALKDYFVYVKSLQYDTQPDYEKVRTLFRNGLKKAGYKDDGVSVILPSSVPKKRPRATPKEDSDEFESEEIVKPAPKRRGQQKKAPSPEKPPPPAKQRAAPARAKAAVLRTASGKPATVVRAANGTVPSDDRVVHKRVRRKNVPTRDFAQSP